MNAIRQRNSQAMQYLYDRYFRRAFALAVRMLGDAAAAEDCVHDAFLKVWQQPEMYDERRGNFASWFLATVHNRASNILRSQRHQASGPPPGVDGDGEKREDPEPIDETSDIESQVWQREQQRIVQHALTELNDAQRQVLDLAYFGGMTQAQIADHLDQPLGTVKTRIRTAMQKLRVSLEAQGWQSK